MKILFPARSPHPDGSANPKKRVDLTDPETRSLLGRLFALTWSHRFRCLGILALQLVLVGIGLLSLGFTGLGIDVIRHAAQPESPPPAWPSWLRLPPDWPVMGVVAVIAALIFFMAVLRAFLNYVYSTRLAVFVQRDVVAQIRADVYDKLQTLSFRFFDEQPSGTIINRVTGDVQQLRSFIDGVVMQSIIMLLSLAIYLTYMIRLHPLLTVACLATTPVLWISAVRFSQMVKPAYRRNRQLVDRLIHYLSECVQGMAVIRGFGLDRHVAEQFRERNDEVFTQQSWIFNRVSLFSPFIGLLTQVNLFVLLLYGGWLVYQHQLALGTGLVVFAGLLQQFSQQASNLASVTNSMQQSLIGARRVFEILDAPVEIQSPPDAHRATRCRGDLHFANVAFAYTNGESVLSEIDLKIPAGKCLAILGPTGSGKSTLLSLVPRFYDPAAGAIRLDGVDLRQWDLLDLRRQIGIVFQENFLFSQSIAENIAFGHPDATREQIERAAHLASADTFIRALPDGYDTVIGEFGMDLSGGQRQRLAIARALLLEPPVLLMDDPTAAIDTQTEAEILAAMDSAMAGRTTLIVAHRISTLRKADHIIVLDGGRIVQSGTHQELLHVPGPYRSVAGLQESH